MNTESRLLKLLALLKSEPNDSFLLFAVAKEYESKGNEQEALAKYTFLLDCDPAYTGTYFHLAKLYERKDEKEKAIVTYRKGIAECKKQNDMHALAELTTALANLEMDLD